MKTLIDALEVAGFTLVSARDDYVEFKILPNPGIPKGFAESGLRIRKDTWCWIVETYKVDRNRWVEVVMAELTFAKSMAKAIRYVYYVGRGQMATKRDLSHMKNLLAA